MSPSRFITLFLVYAIGVAALVAGFNIAVDPYLFFDMPRKPGFNQLKPAAATHERIMKAYDAPRNMARTVILGSSRTDTGLAPQHAVWPSDARPVYNLSLVGSGLGTGAMYLRHLVAARPAAEAPRTIIVGLDFEAFLFKPSAPPIKPRPVAERGEAEQRMLVLADGSANPERALRRLKDFGAVSLSLDAISDSLATLGANRYAAGVNMTPDGHFSEAAFRDTTAADGVAALFAQKNAATVAQFATPHQVLSETPGGPIRELASVRALIDYARQHRITVILAIQPAHASRLNLLTQMGYWPDYERWKRELALLVSAERSAGAAVTLWDFGGYEQYAREPVPAAGDRKTRLKWFWDPVHYTTELGDLIIGRVLVRPGMPEYGVILTPANLDQRLEQVREDQRLAAAPLK
jgi:hypothetical protein